MPRVSTRPQREGSLVIPLIVSEVSTDAEAGIVEHIAFEFGVFGFDQLE